MYVCLCKGLTESDVQRVACPRGTSPEALIHTLGLDADDCCGRCALAIDEFVELAVCHDGVRADSASGSMHWLPAL